MIGRFQRASQVGPDTLETIVGGNPEPARIPVVADASFGHTTPQFTFPIGGRSHQVRDSGPLSNRSSARMPRASPALS